MKKHDFFQNGSEKNNFFLDPPRVKVVLFGIDIYLFYIFDRLGMYLVKWDVFCCYVFFLSL